jgi:hypothetical protein
MHFSFLRLLLLLTVRKHKELIMRGEVVLTRHKAECGGRYSSTHSQPGH